MRTEVRFLLAMGLMLLVLVGTNYLFPPVEPEPPAPAAGGGPGVESPAGTPDTAQPDPTGPADPAPGPPVGGELPAGQPAVEPEPEPDPGRVVSVESPIYRYEFNTRGARMTGAELTRYRSLRGDDGPVDLIPEGSMGSLGLRLVLGEDTVDLRGLPFEAEPADGVVLEEGGPAQDLTFAYRHPDTDFAVEVTYTFTPDSYVVRARGSTEGVGRGLLVTDLGAGVAYTEADSASEEGMMAWVRNHLREGIDSRNLSDIEEPMAIDGPFLWTAFRSRFFVLALLPDATDAEDDYLGGVIVRPSGTGAHPTVAATQNLEAGGGFDHHFFAGPQEYARLSALGRDLEEVNPYGWRFFRPIIRPFVAAITWALSFLHNTLNLGYGWVLILFGVLMRVVLWPLNQKAMRAQIRNMQVQPLVKEIQQKYKKDPERLQKEMMKLYKEHGFNPVAGCLPMLLPWPVLIALFFVFQNTIEFRGVEFLWLPDLSAADPYYLLPVFLALSMFAAQFISYRVAGRDNPQMKMMMWIMPPVLGFIFMRFPAGLNLYYATANLAMIPQQFLIARERAQAMEKAPPVRTED